MREHSAGWSLRRHWPEYLIEAVLLGTFMLSACVVTALLQHPSSWFRQAMPSAAARLLVTGLAMGLTAVALVYSPWGRRSGAHFNPSVTLAFLWLGKVHPWDAAFYVLAQFLGGAAGVALATWLLGEAIAHPAVRWAVTVPGPRGAGAAFVAEVAISFGLMTVVLSASNSLRFARLTGVFAGLLVALWITVEAPVSGMSMNVARTSASAALAGVWTAWWVYATAPLVGMLGAAEVWVRRRGIGRVRCAKLMHPDRGPCLFRCGYEAS